MKKKLPLTLLAAALLAFAAFALSRGRERAGVGAEGEIVRVGRHDFERSVTATGILKPRVGAEVRVGSRASGVVRRLFVKIGDRVEKGAVLAELETGELEALRAQSAAALASARADLAYAEADLARKRELAAAQVLARSDLDLADRASNVATERLREAEAKLRYAATQLGYGRIYAPISGIVASISTQEGETVAASFAAPTFVTLLDLDRLEVRAYVDETDIGRIHAGQAARFGVDTYPGVEFEARVVTVNPQAEIRDNVVNYVAVLRFEPPAGATLRPEMTASVRIELETRRGVLALPRRALRREDGRSFVLVRGGVSREGGGEKRWVRSGAQDDAYLEIAEGLREGEEVLVSAQGETP